MAVRNESVRLSLVDDFTTGMVKAAAAAALLRKQLNDLDGTSVSTNRDLDRTSVSVGKVGSSSRSAGPEIDKFSGRLRVMFDAAVVLAPALVPLGAAIIPALTGSLAALGAASGGIGAAILAFNGLGDAMSAIDDFELDPTAENLQAMRIELENLGPAGADFAKFLQSIGPEMTELQMVAREGMFPGMEEGIESLMTRLPEVRDIISELSEGMGGLAASAGADLAGPEWEPFFEYVRTTARPALEDLGNAIGNVAQGLGSMMVAFAPVSGDFSRGMLEMSESFATWAAGLEDSESFQEFVDYIRQSGPQALDLLGELAGTFIAIVKAAAPIGSAILPVLTALVKVIGAIADTPLGQAFLTAAVAITAYNRAALIATATTTRLGATMRGITGRQAAAGIGLIALSMTDLDEKAGLTNTAMLGMAGLMAGPWGAAIGAGAGAVLDLKAANDDLAASIERANDAAAHGTLKEQRTEYRQLKAGLDDFTFSMNDLLGMHGEEEAALAELRGSMQQTGDVADLFGRDIRVTGDQLRVAAGAAQAFSGAIADLNGWLDKQEALRNYRDALRELTKGLKDGFGREDVENIAAAARGMSQFASLIKDKSLRADFLAGARASLEKMAKDAGPKAQAALQRLIEKMDEFGLTHPEPKLGLDKKQFDKKARDVAKQFDIMDAMSADPTVTANTKAARAHLAAVEKLMNALDGKVATTHVVTIYKRMNAPDYTAPGGPDQLFGGPRERPADGATIPGRRYPYGDRVPALLAPGEEVISNRHGQADRNRALLKAINANRMAGGGTAGGQNFGSTTRPWDLSDNFNALGFATQQLANAANDAAGGLKSLKQQVREAEKAHAAEKSQLDALKSARDEAASAVSSAWATDPFAASDSSEVPEWADRSVLSQGALSGGIAEKQEALRLLKQLRKRGLDGAAFVELAAQGQVELLRAYVAMSTRELRTYESQFEQNQRLDKRLGKFAGDAGYGAAIKAQAGEVRESNRELKALNKRMASIEKKLDGVESAAATRGPKNFAAALNFSGAKAGSRR